MTPPPDDVLFRLLLAKSLLDGTRMLPVADADDFFVAQQVLTAHDAADLAIAAVASHCNVPTKGSNYLMDNIAAVSNSGKQMISTSCLEKPAQKTLRLCHIYHSPGGHAR